MFKLKSLSKDGIPGAIEKAERYRLLNEPEQAESICLDALAVDADNQRAQVILLLALTDQFPHRSEPAVTRARDVLGRLQSEYERVYYAGVIAERRARALQARGNPGAGFAAYEGFHEAMRCYEKAESLRPPGNDDALLRWNTCARILDSDPHLRPAPPEDRYDYPLE